MSTQSFKLIERSRITRRYGGMIHSRGRKKIARSADEMSSVRARSRLDESAGIFLAVESRSLASLNLASVAKI